MKKLFIISGSFFLLVIAFLLVYNFAFRHNTANPVADPDKKAEEEKKRAAENEATNHSVVFEQVIPEDVFQPVAGENSIFYYSPRDNALKEMSFDGQNPKNRITNFPSPPVRFVWSPNRLGVLYLLRGETGELWYYVDLRNNVVTPLKPGMTRLAWTALGDRILYQYTDPVSGERSLNTSSPDGSNWIQLTSLGTDDHFISSVPQSSLVAFWKRTDGNKESPLETVSITGEGRRTVATGRFGADYLWSPDSRRLLIQSVTEAGGNILVLGMTDDAGSGYRNLFAPTLVSKVTWSKDSENFYYALPGAFQDNVVLPNDYYGKPEYSKDTFWKMNVKTGKKERLVPLEEMTQAFDASDVFLAPTETDLYFVDRVTKKLYRITL